MKLTKRQIKDVVESGGKIVFEITTPEYSRTIRIGE